MFDALSSDYEHSAGGMIPRPPKKKRSRAAIWLVIISLAVPLTLFGFAQAIANWATVVESGQIRICETTNGTIYANRKPGLYWCFGRTTSFSMIGQVEEDFLYHFQDGTEATVKVDLTYSIPPFTDLDEIDPTVMMYIMYHSQEEFEDDALHRAILSAVSNTFSDIESSTFYADPQEVPPVLRKTIYRNIHAQVQEVLGKGGLWINIDLIQVTEKPRMPPYRAAGVPI